MGTSAKRGPDEVTTGPTIAHLPATGSDLPAGTRGPVRLSLQEQLDLAIRVEKVAAQIYAVLAQRFGDSPEEHAMFSRLEQEELQHALRIEMLGTVLARRPELQFEPVLDVRRMTQALRDGEDVALLVADPTRSMTVSQARRMAAALELKFSSVHAEQLTTVSEPSLHELFSVFVAQDKEHAALLSRSKK